MKLLCQILKVHVRFGLQRRLGYIHMMSVLKSHSIELWKLDLNIFILKLCTNTVIYINILNGYEYWWFQLSISVLNPYRVAPPRVASTAACWGTRRGCWRMHCSVQGADVETTSGDDPALKLKLKCWIVVVLLHALRGAMPPCVETWEEAQLAPRGRGRELDLLDDPTLCEQVATVGVPARPWSVSFIYSLLSVRSDPSSVVPTQFFFMESY